MKEEALKLADLLAISGKESIEREASVMIRRLVEELDKQKETIRNLNKTLGFVNSGYEVINLEPQTKPLSDEEIEYYEHLIAKLFNCSTTQKVIGLDRVIRAIEERHGIK